MQAILTQQKCLKTLKSEILIPAYLTQEKAIKMMDMTKSVIIPCLEDKVLRKSLERNIDDLM